MRGSFIVSGSCPCLSSDTFQHLHMFWLHNTVFHVRPCGGDYIKGICDLGCAGQYLEKKPGRHVCEIANGSRSQRSVRYGRHAELSLKNNPRLNETISECTDCCTFNDRYKLEQTASYSSRHDKRASYDPTSFRLKLQILSRIGVAMPLQLPRYIAGQRIRIFFQWLTAILHKREWVHRETVWQDQATERDCRWGTRRSPTSLHSINNAASLLPPARPRNQHAGCTLQCPGSHPPVSEGGLSCRQCIGPARFFKLYFIREKVFRHSSWSELVIERHSMLGEMRG